MKKLVALLVVLTLIVSVLAGCKYLNGDKGGNIDDPNGNNTPDGDGTLIMTTLPEGMSGKEAARLILANQRLNAQLLKNSENIFADGSETLMGLADAVTYSLANNTFIAPMDEASGLDGASKYVCVDGSFAEVAGSTFRWSGFQEYSNSYDYFLNLTKNISTSATAGAELIDNVKKHVRVVDKWVDMGYEEYYLHVEENCEILYSRNDDHMTICKRTKDAEGANVYEVYRENASGGSSRMVYSEGKICEYSYVYDSFNHNFLAVNNKGFWEVVDVGVQDTHYNVSCMVIKDDICYDGYYNPDAEVRKIELLKVVSADRETDIMNVISNETVANITLNLQGFTGYDYIELITTPDKILPLEGDYTGSDVVYYTNGEGTTVYQTVSMAEAIELVMKNGTAIKSGDTFVGGLIEVERIIVNHFSKEPPTGSVYYSDGYAPELILRVTGDGFDSQVANLEAFLAEAGLVCNRDMEYVKNGVKQAELELEQFVKYHTWNESPIYTEEDLAQGWENNLAKHEAYKAMLEAIKDAEVVDFANKEAMQLAISFSPIGSQSATAVSNTGLTVSVDELKLTATDTMLFVVGEEYSVYFALVGADKTLNHIYAEGLMGTAYAEGESFTVSGNATFDIPVLGEGEYTLVAYISTKDGIRSSDYTPLAFTALTEGEVKVDNYKVNIKKGSSNEAKLTFTALTDFEVTVPAPESGAHTAYTMLEALSKEIYNYGFVAEDAVLEKLLPDGSWEAVPTVSIDSDTSGPDDLGPMRPDGRGTDGTAVNTSADTPAEEPLTDGTYRLKYNVKNGDKIKEGYIFTVYTAPTAEQSTPET